MKTQAICIFLLVAILHYGTSEKDNILEVTMIVEPQVVRNYQNLGYTTAEAAEAEIKEDLKYIFFQTQKLFTSLSAEISLGIRIKDVQFTSDAIFASSDVTNGGVQATNAVKEFKSWLSSNNIYSDVEYDMAILLTGYTLRWDGSEVTDFTEDKGGACSANGVAVVNFYGTQLTAHGLAAALGNGLGASIDGVGNTCTDGYIMSDSIVTNSSNRWNFSACSEQAIVHFVSNLGTDSCLKKTTAKPSSFNLKDVKGRDILNPNEVCQRLFKDKTSFLCMYKGIYTTGVKGDALCQALWCGPNSLDRCLIAMPSEGMMCDENKRCDRGKCIEAPPGFPTPSTLNPTCLFNDSKTDKLFGGFSGSCQDYVNANGYFMCYRQQLQQQCCQTCEKARTNIADCEFGDKNAWCLNNINPLSTRCYSTNKNLCCGTCRNYT